MRRVSSVNPEAFQYSIEILNIFDLLDGAIIQLIVSFQYSIEILVDVTIYDGNEKILISLTFNILLKSSYVIHKEGFKQVCKDLSIFY